MNINEMIDIMSKQWCVVDDLAKLAGVGKKKALVIKRIIREDFISKGYYVPERHIPMKAVVNYLKIDVSYLKAMLKLQRKAKEDQQ